MSYQGGINQLLGIAAGGIIAGKKIAVKYSEEKAKIARAALASEKQSRMQQKKDISKRIRYTRKKGGRK